MKDKKEIIFIIGGILLFFILITFSFYSINFLVNRINGSFDADATGNQEIQRVNFEGLKKIGIIKE